MESLPSEYKDLGLSKNEKMLFRNILSQDRFGYIIINANPCMLENNLMHVLITTNGVIFIKPLEAISNTAMFSIVMNGYKKVHDKAVLILTQKLINNKTLVGEDGKLKIKVSIIYLLSKIDRQEIESTINDEILLDFSNKNCVYKDEISIFRNDFDSFINKLLENVITPVSNTEMEITDANINSILQRIAPEYVTVRFANTCNNNVTSAGASEESMIVNENDVAVKAYRLDKEQINIINKINKGERLILACAGSGKSVLIISKCFKAAAMNPSKKFLITCFNRNLYSLYTWFIDMAGLREKNVECMTFHKLCKHLLEANGKHAYGNPDNWSKEVLTLINSNSIKTTYYGIFIDEVQEFETDWYKICYNLLENKNSDDHLFVICGDKTQKIKSQQKHGRAPWNAGEGYPNYRNKSIHIERNYRNCIEINEYINDFVVNAKKYLTKIDPEAELDPDMFLRGKSIYHGFGTHITYLKSNTTDEEISAIIKNIRKIHDEYNIPYDEIAVIMNLGKYKKIIKGWCNLKYCLEDDLKKTLEKNNISYCVMFNTETEWADRFGEKGGVKLLKADSVLGLDFRATIVCGLVTLGEYYQSKQVDWDSISKDEEKKEEIIKDTQDCIRRLYVTCTRAKEYLEIIIPSSKSIYYELLEESYKMRDNNGMD